MSRQKSNPLATRDVEYAYCNFYIYGKNFEYLLEIQGEYEKKGKVMGLARVLDIIITASRLAQKEIKCDKLVKKGSKGAVDYKAFGENRSYLIDLKVSFKKKNLIDNNEGLSHVINSIVSHTRIGK